jgi:hypothetical protein
MGKLIFSHCHACAENDEGEAGCDPGVGCPAYGPSDDCEAVWIEEPAGRAALKGAE